MEKETKKKAVVHKKKEVKEIAAEQPVAAKVVKAAAPKLPANKYFGTGRRKESRAKVWLIPGNGQVIINGKPYVEYFCHRQSALSPIAKTFSATKTEGKYDVIATCSGGGVTAQATAVSMGIARAMVRLSEDLKTFLRREGLLTRDPRMKERKKYGLKRARRAFQFTKR